MSTSSNTVGSYGLNDLAEITFPESGADVSFRLLQDAVVPRPVYLVSTVSETAVNNVAPYSYISPAATTPTAFVLSVLRRDDGSEKDTLINLRASGEIVINAVTETIVRAANACAENLPPHRSEFELTGLTPAFLSARAARRPVATAVRMQSRMRDTVGRRSSWCGLTRDRFSHASVCRESGVPRQRATGYRSPALDRQK